MDFSNKADSLAKKMNKLTESFDLADEMIVEGGDIIDYVEEKTQNVALYSEEISPTEIVNIENMVSDFKYVRETLKETTDNGRRVLNTVTLDLLDADGDKRASLITSFAELNTAVGNNMKLYMQSYKDISTVLLNIDKIDKDGTPSNQTVNNTLNVFNDSEATSTEDLINKLKED